MVESKLLISQLAAKVGMAPSALRFYEEAGLLTPASRTDATRPRIQPMLDYVSPGGPISRVRGADRVTLFACSTIAAIATNLL